MGKRKSVLEYGDTYSAAMMRAIGEFLSRLFHLNCASSGMIPLAVKAISVNRALRERRIIDTPKIRCYADLVPCFMLPAAKKCNDGSESCVSTDWCL